MARRGQHNTLRPPPQSVMHRDTRRGGGWSNTNGKFHGDTSGATPTHKSPWRTGKQTHKLHMVGSGAAIRPVAGTMALALRTRRTLARTQPWGAELRRTHAPGMCVHQPHTYMHINVQACLHAHIHAHTHAHTSHRHMAVTACRNILFRTKPLAHTQRGGGAAAASRTCAPRPAAPPTRERWSTFAASAATRLQAYCTATHTLRWCKGARADQCNAHREHKQLCVLFLRRPFHAMCALARVSALTVHSPVHTMCTRRCPLRRFTAVAVAVRRRQWVCRACAAALRRGTCPGAPGNGAATAAVCSARARYLYTRIDA